MMDCVLSMLQHVQLRVVGIVAPRVTSRLIRSPDSQLLDNVIQIAPSLLPDS